MTDINDLKGRFYIQETHIRLRDGGKTTRKNGVAYTPYQARFWLKKAAARKLPKRDGG